MIATAGTWDRSDRRIIFLASNPSVVRRGSIPDTHPYCLLAVNDLQNDSDFALVDDLIERGARVLIDSGIFWLTNEHKRAHGITMDEALALAPDEIRGFDDLWTRYVHVVRYFGERAWGYMELDQGGEKNKRITRAKLHDLGIFPIPVWHPLNDGADYFDELASTYDRICLGNVVQADRRTRLRLLHAMTERHRRYPDLWVHVLGMNPNEWFHAFPIDSADASTWVAPVRWGRFPQQVMLDPDVEKMHYDTTYAYAESPLYDPEANDSDKALQMSALALGHTQVAWRDYQAELADLLELAMYEPV